MKKLAIFVEGYTEVVFVTKLIEEIAGKNNVLIEPKRIRGGSTTRRTMREIRAAQPYTGQQYYVLIYDCGGDEQVKTRILEEHETLTRAGHTKLIGIRDVRPKFSYAEIPRLEASLPKYIKTKFAPVIFILSIMEIEAWFLAEVSHFTKIEPSITVAAIKASLGFDPENDDLEQRPSPANDLNDCYAIGGKTYQKGQAQITVDALDYATLYLELRTKINYLGRLIQALEEFLT